MVDIIDAGYSLLKLRNRFDRSMGERPRFNRAMGEHPRFLPDHGVVGVSAIYLPVGVEKAVVTVNDTRVVYTPEHTASASLEQMLVEARTLPKVVSDGPAWHPFSRQGKHGDIVKYENEEYIRWEPFWPFYPSESSLASVTVYPTKLPIACEVVISSECPTLDDVRANLHVKTQDGVKNICVKKCVD